MLKNSKLLYILPEMAFTASVGETPKTDYFYVQSFHQINGEFMKDENFLFENLKKLFERVDEETYTLVLPDFLFTDTIVNVPEVDDLKIAEHLRDQLLPRIEVSTFSHETRTSILLQRKKTAKVQLSAFEKELAATIKLATGSRNIIIDEIVPLSWALKAAVSLEPSITIAQLGERLYLAEHYIGINQTINAPLSDLDIVAETIKTLKGSDPNLQTVYLLTSVLVEEKLKKFLTKTLPVQQLTEPNEEEAKIPSYVKQIIEVSARTLSLSEFVVPRFSLVVDQTVAATPKIDVPKPVKVEVEAVEVIEETVAPVDAEPESPAEPEVTPAAAKVDDIKKVTPPAELKAEADSNTVVDKVALDEEPKLAPATKVTAIPEGKASPQLEASTTASLPTTKAVPEITAQSAVFLPDRAESAAPATTSETLPTLSFMKKTEPDLKPTPSEIKAEARSEPETEKPTPAKEKNPAEPVVAKTKKGDRMQSSSNKKGHMGTFFKKLFLFILIFAITIALGIAVGLGILMLSGRNPFGGESPTPSPTPESKPEVQAPPTIESADEPEASAADEVVEELDLTTFNIQVVNATGIAGLAGGVKTKLETAGFTKVATGNAKGEYEQAGTFVLMKERDSALIKALEEGTGRTLTFDEDIATEDAAGTYDAVIVLNEQ